MANQDGGAHVDPDVDKQYKRLLTGESLGRKYSSDGKSWFNMHDAVVVSIRQITHETIKSLNPEYHKKPTYGKGGALIFLGGIKVFPGAKSSSSAKSTKTPHQKVGRNDPCPCGSGKKYKKCCGNNKYGS